MLSATSRILIADDAADLRRALRNILESRPTFRVCGKASSGTEAVAKARELNPDLIILDLQMPGLNGFEAARQILQFSPSMPIIIFSMHFSSQLMQEAQNVGIRGYIQKGSGFETIIEAVEAALRGDSFFLAHSEA